MILSYGTDEMNFLSNCDKKLGKFIAKTGFVERNGFDDIFSGMCYNIINQQLSMKAADRLYEKIGLTVGDIVPEKMQNADLLSKYVSRSKAECIALLAEQFICGKLSSEKLSEWSDEDVLKNLTSIRGIGAWTAEMTMIFCLGRRDVLSLSDYGIRKGLSVLHKIDIKDIKSMQKFKKLYSPYGTTASIYLWEINKGELV